MHFSIASAFPRSSNLLLYLVRSLHHLLDPLFNIPAPLPFWRGKLREACSRYRELRLLSPSRPSSPASFPSSNPSGGDNQITSFCASRTITIFQPQNITFRLSLLRAGIVVLETSRTRGSLYLSRRVRLHSFLISFNLKVDTTTQLHIHPCRLATRSNASQGSTGARRRSHSQGTHPIADIVSFQQSTLSAQRVSQSLAANISAHKPIPARLC